MFNSSLFDEKERNIIIMALMYLKNDYTLRDLKELGYGKAIDEFTNRSCWEFVEFEDVVQNLMEDIIRCRGLFRNKFGPTWDEKATTANLKTETAKRTRKGEDHKTSHYGDHPRIQRRKQR